jgi:hypothetical protein
MSLWRWPAIKGCEVSLPIFLSPATPLNSFTDYTPSGTFFIYYTHHLALNRIYSSLANISASLSLSSTYYIPHARASKLESPTITFAVPHLIIPSVYK